MNQDFGHEIPKHHVEAVHRRVTKYLIVIAGPDGPAAKLFDAHRALLSELDANTEEVTSMLKGLAPDMGTSSADWARQLSGHSAEERASAVFYTLGV